MKLDKEQVEHIAGLAQLSMSDDELERFTTTFNTMLDYIDQLREVDTQAVEPMTAVTGNNTPMREDRCKDSLPIDQVLANAPEAFTNFFIVPKVVE